MDSDEEVEAFEITDQDLQSELHPGRRHMQTRAEAIYGIWANSDDEEEVGGGYTRKTRKKMSDYSEPMGFVSGGVVNEDDDDDDKKNEQDDSVKQEPAKQEEKEKFVASKSTSGKKLKQDLLTKTSGFDSARFKKNTKQFGAWEKYTTGFGSKMLEKEKGTSQGVDVKNQMGYKGQGLGKGGREKGTSQDVDVKNQGIVEPVQAFKRGGRAAVGAYGSEKGEAATREPVYDTDEEEEQEIKQEIEKLHQWKRTGQEVKKPKYVYKTADEVKKDGKSKRLAPLLANSNVKVLDMTGPETKILSGYGSLGNQHAKPDEGQLHPGVDTSEEKAFDMPELIYNLKLLVDLTESEIIQVDRKLRFEDDNTVNMTHELDRLEKICAEEEVEVDNLEHVLKIIQRKKELHKTLTSKIRCQDGLQPDVDAPLTLEGLIKCFQTLQENFYQEYKLYDLEKLVIPLGFPLLTRHFSIWQPFQQPTHGLDVVKLWKEVLDESKQKLEFDYDENRSMGPFDRLMWEVWIPHLRRAIGTWMPREPDPLIAILEAWIQLIPEWILANILDQLILPKLQMAVENWNPLLDPTPIHSWLHPWLPIMAERLEPLYAPIRQKFSSALMNWYPSDPSAKVILEPWVKIVRMTSAITNGCYKFLLQICDVLKEKGTSQDVDVRNQVFSKGTMEAFLIRSIYPKLEQCLIEFKINPHQQHLEPFNWFMAWKDILSVHHMVSILDKHFFSKWLQVLRQWLASEPNYDEVTKWYLGWKSMFPEDYANNPTVKEHFNRALTLMNQAVSGTYQPGAKENVAYLTSTERRREAEHAALKSEKFASSSTNNKTSIPTRFKDLVEQAANDNGVLFIPLPNRRHEGKAVYSFGRCVIYIDRDVLFYSNEGQWKPTSLQDLLEICR